MLNFSGYTPLCGVPLIWDSPKWQNLTSLDTYQTWIYIGSGSHKKKVIKFCRRVHCAGKLIFSHKTLGCSIDWTPERMKNPRLIQMWFSVAKVTASLGEEAHLFLRSADRRLHYSGQVRSLIFAGHSNPNFVKYSSRMCSPCAMPGTPLVSMKMGFWGFFSSSLSCPCSSQAATMLLLPFVRSYFSFFMLKFLLIYDWILYPWDVEWSLQQLFNNCTGQYSVYYL